MGWESKKGHVSRKGMNVGNLSGSMILDLSGELRLILSSLMPAFPHWVSFLTADLDQSIAASSRAVSPVQMTRYQVTDHPRGDRRGGGAMWGR